MLFSLYRPVLFPLITLIFSLFLLFSSSTFYFISLYLSFPFQSLHLSRHLYSGGPLSLHIQSFCLNPFQHLPHLLCMWSSTRSVLFFLSAYCLTDKENRFSSFDKVRERTDFLWPTLLNMFSVWKRKRCSCSCSWLKDDDLAFCWDHHDSESAAAVL